MASFELTDTAESWPVTSSEDLHRDHWVVALRADIVTTPDGGEGFRRLADRAPGCGDGDGGRRRRAGARPDEYRHPVQQRLVELPAGLCDVPGEDPLEVARRELLEEAALEATEWTHLLSTWSSPGLTNERMFIYLARGLSAGDRGDFLLEHEEASLTTAWVPYDELLAAVLDGRVADGPVVQAVLAYAARRDELRP